MFVNIPLAVGFGWLVALFYKPAFEISVILGYWFTNVLGLVLMQKGAKQALAGRSEKYSRKDFARDLGFSFVYTVLIIVLLRCGVLHPLNLHLLNSSE